MFNDHMAHPRHFGSIPDPDARGRVFNPLCGDNLEMTLRVQDGVIVELKFQTYSCGVAVATCSLLAEKVAGLRVEEAERLGHGDLVAEMGALPADKVHCPNLAFSGLKAVLRDFREREAGKADPHGVLAYEIHPHTASPGERP
ncbi:MAG: iron-sulfur cluster assembly scaffold protein [Deltaproteobacteria bacterium]|nr:iron-sulfur cluster assembly scaffold protein [Deltaproteobacteria bacterium]